MNRIDIPLYYTRQAIRIFREEGFIQLARKCKDFILWRNIFSFDDMFIFRTYKNNLLNRIQYDAAPQPYKKIRVEARDINTILSWYEGDTPLESIEYIGLTDIRSGDWDAPEYRIGIRESYIINGMIERFYEEKDWEETSYYKEKCRNFKETKEHKNRGYYSVKKYMQHECRKYEQLYETIQSDGYQSGHIGTCKQPGKTQPIRDQLEVLVSIDRNGTIHFFDGYHRFGIAWALDLEIPVQIAYRHKKWQELRDDIYNNGLSERYNKKLETHPDLQDVLAGTN